MNATQLCEFAARLNGKVPGLADNFQVSSVNDVYVEPSGKIFTVDDAVDLLLGRLTAYMTFSIECDPDLEEIRFTLLKISCNLLVARRVLSELWQPPNSKDKPNNG